MVERRSSVVVALGILFMLFHSTFQQLVPLNSSTERLALFELRSSLRLRSKDWPKKVDPCSVWVGVQCHNGRVIGINISGFKRTRIGSQNPQFAVDALSNFTLLASFNASRFLLPGPIPNLFGNQLRSLQVLDLRSCSITGVIPATLGNLSNLFTLYLSNNALIETIPSDLGQLLRLSVLDLSHNMLTGSIPFSFGSLVNLTVLDMSWNLLSWIIPPTIGTLSKLQFLNLSSNSLSSSIPPQLGDLSNLVSLDLSSNALSGSIPADLAGLSNLQLMVLGHNLLTGSLPSNLFPSLTRLQYIGLNVNNFSGDLLDILWSVPELLFLDVSVNNFTGTLPNISLNSNGTDVVLNLSQNTFYGGLTPVLRRFSIADLSGNYFEGGVPDFALRNASLGNNCLQNISSQRSGAACAAFYSERGLQFDEFGLPNGTHLPPAKKRHKDLIIMAGVLGGIGFIALLVVVAVLLIVSTRKRAVTNQTGGSARPVPLGGGPRLPQLTSNFSCFSSLGEEFTYQQILHATDNFKDVNLIKHGHSGDIFQGTLQGGNPVVIKKIDLCSVKKEAYMLELDFFIKVHHARLVPLVGHCLVNENEKFLVYKYLPNGDLSSSLFRKTNSGSMQSLDWITRLKIAIGAAEGLSYLHHECVPPYAHRDVQASSILLDDKFEVRLGSLSEACGLGGDSHQSLITRLLRLPPPTSEQSTSGSASAMLFYDIYCFGKVLLELITGKLGISSTAASEADLNSWLEGILPNISINDRELMTNIVDPSLTVDDDLLEEVWSVAIVARSCLNPNPPRRPLMRYVLKALENPLKVLRAELAGSETARFKNTASSGGSWDNGQFASWGRSSFDVEPARCRVPLQQN